jgi:hypothetical protein
MGKSFLAGFYNLFSGHPLEFALSQRLHVTPPCDSQQTMTFVGMARAYRLLTNTAPL